MTVPSDIYAVASGLPIYGGRAAAGGGGTPVWAAAAPLDAWISIPGTNQTISATNWAGSHGKPTNGGSQVWLDAWGAMCITPDGELFAPAAGGHTDGEDNRVASCNLMADVPGWVTRTPKSPTVTYEQPYNPDGKPSATHSYYAVFWSEARQRVIRVGATYVSISGNSSFPTMDGWNPAADTWDAAGTYPYLPIGTSSTYPSGVYPAPVAGHYLGASPGEISASFSAGTAMDADGNVWAVGNRLSTLDVWSTPLTAVAAIPPRAPWALDTLRGQMFGLCWGDGQGNSEGVGMVAAKQLGNVQTQITFNASAATAQFATDRPQYGGMDYDEDNDRFLWYEGRRTYTATPGDAGRVGRVFVITPNSGTVWDMSILSYASGATPPPETTNTGMCKRFFYVRALKGFVMLPSVNSGLYFMRTA
jgi:hypothetical protein